MLASLLMLLAPLLLVSDQLNLHRLPGIALKWAMAPHLYPFNNWLRFSPDAATDETRVELVYPTNSGYGITKVIPLQRCRSDRWLEVL